MAQKQRNHEELMLIIDMLIDSAVRLSSKETIKLFRIVNKIVEIDSKAVRSKFIQIIDLLRLPTIIDEPEVIVSLISLWLLFSSLLIYWLNGVKL